MLPTGKCSMSTKSVDADFKCLASHRAPWPVLIWPNCPRLDVKEGNVAPAPEGPFCLVKSTVVYAISRALMAGIHVGFLHWSSHVYACKHMISHTISHTRWDIHVRGGTTTGSQALSARRLSGASRSEHTRKRQAYFGADLAERVADRALDCVDHRLAVLCLTLAPTTVHVEHGVIARDLCHTRSVRSNACDGWCLRAGGSALRARNRRPHAHKPAGVGGVRRTVASSSMGPYLCATKCSYLPSPTQPSGEPVEPTC